jgi:putative lysine/arginine/ornithine/histidine/octopine transport system ATP-binding protein
MALATPALEIRNLHKRYGELEVLKGISLTARDGDVISILGSSGSGKSTLLRCINLLENPHEGQIMVAGEELAQKGQKWRTDCGRRQADQPHAQRTGFCVSKL